MKRSALKIALAMLAIADVAAAQTMVVSAQGPSAGAFPGGTMLRPGAALDLKAGDHVTVFQGGGTRRFDGPGHFLPQQPSPEARTALVSLISQSRPVSASRIGAVRDFGASTSRAAAREIPAGLWQVDIAKPGPFCLAAGQAPQLWRLSNAAAKSTITRLSDNRSAQVEWPANARTVDWPATLPTTDGETYLISTGGGDDAGVSWRSVPAPAGDWTAFAAALAKAGCNAQLDTLKVAVAQR